jgi:hypothetical protein
LPGKRFGGGLPTPPNFGQRCAGTFL